MVSYPPLSDIVKHRLKGIYKVPRLKRQVKTLCASNGLPLPILEFVDRGTHVTLDKGQLVINEPDPYEKRPHLIIPFDSLRHPNELMDEIVDFLVTHEMLLRRTVSTYVETEITRATHRDLVEAYELFCLSHNIHPILPLYQTSDPDAGMAVREEGLFHPAKIVIGADILADPIEEIIAFIAHEYGHLLNPQASEQEVDSLAVPLIGSQVPLRNAVERGGALVDGTEQGILSNLDDSSLRGRSIKRILAKDRKNTVALYGTTEERVASIDSTNPNDPNRIAHVRALIDRRAGRNDNQELG